MMEAKTSTDGVCADPSQWDILCPDFLVAITLQPIQHHVYVTDNRDHANKLSRFPKADILRVL